MNANTKLAEELEKKQEIERKIDFVRKQRDYLILRLQKAEKDRLKGALSITEYESFLEEVLDHRTSEEVVDDYNKRIFSYEKKLMETDSGINLFKEIKARNKKIGYSEQNYTKLNIAFVVMLLVVGVSMFAGLQLDNPTGFVVKESDDDSHKSVSASESHTTISAPLNTSKQAIMQDAAIMGSKDLNKE